MKGLTTQTGFTLIELLVSLTIIGIMFGLGFVNFREYSRRQHLAAGAGKIIADLRATQEKALSGEKPVACGVNDSLLDYRVTFSAGTNSYSILATCEIGAPTEKVVAMTSDVKITAPLPVPNPIIFKVLGQGTNIPDGGSAVIKLSDGVSDPVTVTVTSGGEIK